MTDLRKAAQAVVDRWDTPSWKDVPATAIYIEALRQALAEPEQEPVAWQDPQYKTLIEPHKAHPDWIPLYTAPPKREWVELTNEDIHNTEGYEENRKMFRFAKSLLAKAKEKNT